MSFFVLIGAKPQSVPRLLHIYVMPFCRVERSPKTQYAYIIPNVREARSTRVRFILPTWPLCILAAKPQTARDFSSKGLP